MRIFIFGLLLAISYAQTEDITNMHLRFQQMIGKSVGSSDEQDFLKQCSDYIAPAICSGAELYEHNTVTISGSHGDMNKGFQKIHDCGLVTSYGTFTIMPTSVPIGMTPKNCLDVTNKEDCYGMHIDAEPNGEDPADGLVCSWRPDIEKCLFGYYSQVVEVDCPNGAIVKGSGDPEGLFGEGKEGGIQCPYPVTADNPCPSEKGCTWGAFNRCVWGNPAGETEIEAGKGGVMCGGRKREQCKSPCSWFGSYCGMVDLQRGQVTKKESTRMKTFSRASEFDVVQIILFALSGVLGGLIVLLLFGGFTAWFCNVKDKNVYVDATAIEYKNMA